MTPATDNRTQPSQMATEAETAAELTERFRPSTVRVLFVGESSPAGGTHFYRANSGLYRATRQAFELGSIAARPPASISFLDWFRDLGCWLVDLADRPFDDIPTAHHAAEVDTAITRLATTIQQSRPERVVVVLRRIAPAVRAAAQRAGVAEGAIVVLPFPTRQWRPVYVEQLTGMVNEVLGGSALPLREDARQRDHVSRTEEQTQTDLTGFGLGAPSIVRPRLRLP
jgi:hypothetical protein